MLYLIIYLVPIERSQCLRGGQSRYILFLYNLCTMVMAVRVFFLFCQMDPSLRWNDDDTWYYQLGS